MDIKAVFMGTPDFSVNIANALLQSGINITACITQPDKEAGRGKKLRFSPVKEWALENNIEVYQPERIRNTECIEKVKEFAPDLIVTAAYGQIIPVEILDIPSLGAVNVHASLLPEYRGASPIQQALFDGKKVTGVTLQYMNEKMDEGDIIIMRELEIAPEDNAGTLFDKLAVLGADIIKDYAAMLQSGKPEGIKQDHSLATYCKKIEKERGNIDWSMDAEEIFNIIRAMNPAPGAYTFLNGKRIKILKAGFDTVQKDGEPGKVLSFDKKAISVKCGKGILLIESLQPEGKSAMQVRDFINGNKLDNAIFERNI